jgi:hypothetical protein
MYQPAGVARPVLDISSPRKVVIIVASAVVDDGVSFRATRWPRQGVGELNVRETIG